MEYMGYNKGYISKNILLSYKKTSTQLNVFNCVFYVNDTSLCLFNCVFYVDDTSLCLC